MTRLGLHISFDGQSWHVVGEAEKGQEAAAAAVVCGALIAVCVDHEIIARAFGVDLDQLEAALIARARDTIRTADCVPGGAA